MNLLLTETSNLEIPQFLNLPNLFAALALIGINIWLASFKHADKSTKRFIRYTLAIGLWLDEILWHYWNYAEGQWNIQTMIMEGRIPKRVLSLVLEWAYDHRDELLKNWNSLQTIGDYSKIAPLE